MNNDMTLNELLELLHEKLKTSLKALHELTLDVDISDEIMVDHMAKLRKINEVIVDIYPLIMFLEVNHPIAIRVIKLSEYTDEAIMKLLREH